MSNKNPSNSIKPRAPTAEELLGEDKPVTLVAANAPAQVMPRVGDMVNYTMNDQTEADTLLTLPAVVVSVHPITHSATLHVFFESHAQPIRKVPFSSNPKEPGTYSVR